MRWALATTLLAAALLIGGLALASPVNSQRTSHLVTASVAGGHGSFEFDAPIQLIYAEDTGSMRPAITGNLLIVVPAEDVQVGDIVVYQNGNKLIAHRVVDISRTSNGISYLLKGDANVFDDGWQPADALKWRVVGILY
jgi:signal peptidase I